MIALSLAFLLAQQPVQGLDWNAANVEHLLNRAAFGARPQEIARALEETPEAFVDQLLEGADEPPQEFAYEVVHRPLEKDFDDQKDYFEACAQRRCRERTVTADFAGWWMDQMVRGPHPAREKMVLFWHNHFVSSETTVLSYVAMIRQNELLRREALTSFRTLLHAIVRDPAMIVYLDNDQNVVGNPNENLAREIMELFALGIGNYTEQDIKEGARALTGWKTDDIATAAHFVARLHDKESKTILGKSGDFDADGFVDILLEQQACPRFIAGKLLAYYEGVKPDEARLAEYADYLKAKDYELTPFLRKLFLDPRFYRDEIRGQRIAGPVEFVVGSARRLGIEVPPKLLWLAAAQLGQRLLEPPNVKGWEEGAAWIRTATMLGRGNMAGVLTGLVRPDAVIQEARMDGLSLMDDESVSGFVPELDLHARLQALGAESDAELVDALTNQLLAVPLTEESRAGLLDFLAAERSKLGGDDALGAGDGEEILRRLLHVILSLPEAQLS